MSATGAEPYFSAGSHDVVGTLDQEAVSMDTNAPITLVAASYRTHLGAVNDFDALWGARQAGEFHHTAIAVLTKDATGDLQVRQNNNTAKHLTWGGALLGGALFVLAPAVGVEMLAAVGMSGAGAIVGHLRHNTTPEALAHAANVLEEGMSGLVALVVNRRGEAVTPLLEHARTSVSVDMLWGDLEEELCQDFARPLAERVLIAS
jgi:uncharacterized membrane protein